MAEDVRTMEDSDVPPHDAAIESDTGVPADAQVAVDAASDAGADKDAGCRGSDQDDDGICASDDNCPSVSNLDQQDVDGDGEGDACDSEPCDVEPLEDMTSFIAGTVTSVLVDGTAKVAQVQPGAQFTLAVGYFLDQCIVGVPTALQIGFEEGPADCVMSGLCVPQQMGTANKDLVAPSEPGIYYVRARLSTVNTCVPNASAPWGTDFATSKRVGAICVRRVLH